MYKRLLILNGLAIFAVVWNHAGGFGQIGLFVWADSYRAVVSPDWSQLGSISHYFLLSIRQIAAFCVPAFFFASGFFVSYAALNKRDAVNRSFVWRRILALAIPYLIWSIVLVGADKLQGNAHTLPEYLVLFISKGVIGPFWFIPALCYCYILSPFLVRFVQGNWKIALAITGIIQLIPVVIEYLTFAGIGSPWVGSLTRFFPSWTPFPWIFFFTFGITAGFHSEGFKQGLLKYRKVLLALVLVTAIFNILEADFVLRSTLQNWGAYNGTISYNLYATTFILWFLGLAAVPFPKQLNELGIRSFGIYLLHYPFIEFLARLIHNIFPPLLAYPILLVPLLALVGLAFPLLIMLIFRKSPVKRYHRYFFS